MGSGGGSSRGGDMIPPSLEVLKNPEPTFEAVCHCFKTAVYRSSDQCPQTGPDFKGLTHVEAARFASAASIDS